MKKGIGIPIPFWFIPSIFIIVLIIGHKILWHI